MLVPAIAAARAGMNVTDPLPPDTIFMRARTGEFDVVLAMYHDQGLIPVKLWFGQRGERYDRPAVFALQRNHGTASDIAGRGIASEAKLHVRWHLAAVDS